jgi:hypothetical protein
MKRRARRAVLGATALVAVLVAALVVSHWSTVRDHVEAWHFQLTHETKTIEPLNSAEVLSDSLHVFQLLSTGANLRVICDPDERDIDGWRASPKLSVDTMLLALRENGYCVLEQRFPRRAFVVIRTRGMEQEEEEEDISRLLDDIIKEAESGTERP